jgi:subtilase family serine protease
MRRLRLLGLFVSPPRGPLGDNKFSSIPWELSPHLRIIMILRAHSGTAAKFWLLVACLSVVAVLTLAQTTPFEPLITERVDDSKLTVLKDNTYPLALPQYDRGAVSPTLLIQHRMLVLKRSPEQEAALEKLLDEQLQASSPNYHKWLTPPEFGQQFGPAPQDIRIVVAWLESHGLQAALVSPARTAIEFSGTAAEVQQTFHTEIHNYDVNGEMHWANVSDPEIPTALTPVVAGVVALHDFKPRPLGHVVRTWKENAARELKPARPLFDFPLGCTVGGTGTTACGLPLGPRDFETIYNLTSLYNIVEGTGQTIAVMGQATINPSDVSAFRVMFSVEPTTNLPTVLSLPNDAPPSQSADTADESESDLDLEWAGAIAPRATIEFVTSSNVIDSAFCTVNNFPNSSSLITPSDGCHIGTAETLPQIMSLSYGYCEAGLGSANNLFTNALWQQAAGEGITVLASTGDTGSANCENPNPNTMTAQPATTGLGVSGLASTPYNTAVGGTDLDDATNLTAYWNTSNTSGTLESAKGYIPERTYNFSCTSEIWGLFSTLSKNPETNCNTTSLTLDGQPYAQFIASYGGGGGASIMYSKPLWQAAPGVPNDGARDLPDVSIFAGNGVFNESYYVVCQADQTSGSFCTSNGNFIGFGGTSASTQVFAGIMALVNETHGFLSGQGLINPILYHLAQQQSSSTCNSSSPASSCIFYDVTKGTNRVPCVAGSPNCNVSSSSDSNGILSGCDASAGYDLATGLGSINGYNFVNANWQAAASMVPDFQLSLDNCNGTVVIPTPGNAGSFKFTVTQVNSFAGSFTDASDYTCSALPSLSTCTFSASTVDATHTSVTVTVGTTAASMVVPSNRPKGPGFGTTGSTLAMASAACMVLLLLGMRSKYRRFSTALAFVVFLLLVVNAGCGGVSSSSSGGGGGGGSLGTPTGLYPAIVTVTSGSTTHTLNFTVSVR